MSKGGFQVVEYSGWECAYTEIVASERLRAKNPNPPIDKNTFHKIEIEVPEDLRELYVSYQLLFYKKLRNIYNIYILNILLNIVPKWKMHIRNFKKR